MSTPAKMEATPTPATLNDVLIRGDLSKLTEAQRTDYYMRVCQSLGLNPLTKPFDYLTLSGKLVLYAKRDAADQLRKLNGISIEIVSRERAEDLLTVHVRARDKTGRSDEDFGVVPFKSGAGEIAANAWMKAVTKAKRRVTLSISGLGFLDETEVDLSRMTMTWLPTMIRRPSPSPIKFRFRAGACSAKFSSRNCAPPKPSRTCSNGLRQTKPTWPKWKRPCRKCTTRSPRQSTQSRPSRHEHRPAS